MCPLHTTAYYTDMDLEHIHNHCPLLNYFNLILLCHPDGSGDNEYLRYSQDKDGYWKHFSCILLDSCLGGIWRPFLVHKIKIWTGQCVKETTTRQKSKQHPKATNGLQCSEKQLLFCRAWRVSRCINHCLKKKIANETTLH